MGMGDPEDLTGAVILLCSDAGKFMTGMDIKIDGTWVFIEGGFADGAVGGYTMF